MRFRELCLLIVALGCGRAEQGSLEHVSAIRGLSSDEAGRPHQVRIQGVVTALSGWRNSFFIQDGTAGISVDRVDSGPDPQAGDRIVVEGVTARGLFAPIIICRRIQILRHGPPLKPRAVDFRELRGGDVDSQWVEVRGIVESATVRQSWGRAALFLDIDMDGQILPARVREFQPEAVEHLVDAEVRVRGVCGTIFNDRGQFVGPRLFVNSGADLRIEKAPPTDPYSAATRPLTSLLTFGTQQTDRHRIKVSGTVTYQRPGHFLYLQDGNQGTYVESGESGRIPPGSRVEVIGFSAAGNYSPLLRAANIRVLPRQGQVLPVMVDAEKVIVQGADFPSAPLDGRLVTTTGRLIQRVVTPEGQLFLLRSGAVVYRARLDADARGKLPRLELDSLLEITGVCVVRTDETREPQSFEIQLRTPDDIRVRQAAPWWNRDRLLQAEALVLSGMALAAGWIVLLRRRVRAQTRAIRENVKRLRASESSLRVTQQQLTDALAKEGEAARRDFLTGLKNRRAFSEAVEDEIHRAQRHGRPMALAYLDLDNFKTVNDTLGHEAGDRLLRIVADTILASVRSTDVSARLGGDEFAVLFPETDADGARVVLEKVQMRILFAMSENGWPVSVSIGAVVYDRAPGNFNEVMAEADRVMYSVKNAGKNSLQVLMESTGAVPETQRTQERCSTPARTAPLFST